MTATTSIMKIEHFVRHFIVQFIINSNLIYSSYRLPHLDQLHHLELYLAIFSKQLVKLAQQWHFLIPSLWLLFRLLVSKRILLKKFTECSLVVTVINTEVEICMNLFFYLYMKFYTHVLLTYVQLIMNRYCTGKR